MEDLFKKMFYTGVGLVAETTERTKKAIDELVEKGKLSQEEGKKVVEDLVEKAESRKEEFEIKLRKLVDATLEKMNIPQAHDFDKLEKRIKSMEVKLGLLNKDIDTKVEKTKTAVDAVAAKGKDTVKAAANKGNEIATKVSEIIEK